MFGLFKKKSTIDILDAKYKQLMKEAFELSRSNRTASDARYAEAERILKEVQELREKKGA